MVRLIHRAQPVPLHRLPLLRPLEQPPVHLPELQIQHLVHRPVRLVHPPVPHRVPAPSPSSSSLRSAAAHELLAHPRGPQPRVQRGAQRRQLRVGARNHARAARRGAPEEQRRPVGGFRPREERLGVPGRRQRARGQHELPRVDPGALLGARGGDEPELAGDEEDVLEDDEGARGGVAEEVGVLADDVVRGVRRGVGGDGVVVVDDGVAHRGARAREELAEDVAPADGHAARGGGGALALAAAAPLVEGLLGGDGVVDEDVEGVVGGAGGEAEGLDALGGDVEALGPVEGLGGPEEVAEVEDVDEEGDGGGGRGNRRRRS